MNIQKLEKKLLIYNQKLVRKNPTKFPPATSIGGMYSSFTNIDHSQPLLPPVANKLLNKLANLGPIGKPSQLCNNLIGSCCEVHVTNNIISKHNNSINFRIQSIVFTRARRPRTNQYIKRCPNCIAIFGNE